MKNRDEITTCEIIIEGIRFVVFFGVIYLLTIPFFCI